MRPAQYPELEEIFAAALHQSPDRNRGVSFEAIAQGVEKIYGDGIRSLGASYRMLPNSVETVRKILLRGSPVIAGYQVNADIDRFHHDARACEQMGFLLPLFDVETQSTSGHAVLLLGYDCSVQAFIARNSWGREWGVDGHFLIPFEAIEDPEFFTDLWALVVDAPR
jgi:hypothetical protein